MGGNTRMLSRLSTENLARSSARKPKRVLLIWLLVLVGAMAAAGTLLADGTSTEFKFLGNPESKQAKDTLEQFLGPEQVTEVVIVRSESMTVDDADFRDVVSSLTKEISRLGPEKVTNAVSFYDTGSEIQVSPDRHTTVIPVLMADGFKAAGDNIGDVHDVLEESSFPDGFEAFIFGEATFSVDFLEGNQKDLEQGEMFAIPLAMIILAIVLGVLAAMFIPIVLAVGSIVIATGTVALISTVFELNAFVQNIIIMIGLSVSTTLCLSFLASAKSGNADLRRSTLSPWPDPRPDGPYFSAA